MHLPRNVIKGGEVGFFIKDDLSFAPFSKHCFQAFKSTSVQTGSECAKYVMFHVLYRATNLSKAQFLDKYSMILEGVTLSGCENILLGDINFILINVTPDEII